MLFLGVLFIHIVGNTAIPEVIHRWRLVDYQFPNDTMRNDSLASGVYIPDNNIPFGIQAWRDKIFLTVPRWRPGVVSTLNYIWKNDTSQSPLLIPYPDWETTRVNSPGSIINICRSRIDECNRLWAVDLGTEDVFGNETTIRNARLIVIDLTTDQIIRSYELKPPNSGETTFFANLEVDTHPSACENAYAYLTDIDENTLTVYHYATNDSWKFEHNYFHFNPLEGHYNISGFDFQLTDGIMGLGLSKIQDDGYRKLFFHPLSSGEQFVVSTKIVRNKAMATSPNYYEFKIVGWKGLHANAPTLRIDPRTEIAYYPVVIQNSVACWNTTTSLSPLTFRVIWHDDVVLDNPNDITLTDEQLCTISGSAVRSNADALGKPHTVGDSQPVVDDVQKMEGNKISFEAILEKEFPTTRSRPIGQCKWRMKSNPAKAGNVVALPEVERAPASKPTAAPHQETAPLLIRAASMFCALRGCVGALQTTDIRARTAHRGGGSGSDRRRSSEQDRRRRDDSNRRRRGDSDRRGSSDRDRRRNEEYDGRRSNDHDRRRNSDRERRINDDDDNRHRYHSDVSRGGSRRELNNGNLDEHHRTIINKYYNFN